MKKAKLNKLSASLKQHIVTEAAIGRNKRKSGTLSNHVRKAKRPVTAMAEETLRHCNGGATLQAAYWLKDHLDNGGKLVITLAGALSSFQIGVMLSDLIRQDKVHLISATGANHEESYYRYIAHSYYAYIPRYGELTGKQEAELRDAGLRRITDTFLPEEEGVRIMEPQFVKMWQEAQRKGERYFPHEYFRKLFSDNLVKPDPETNPDDCWVYAAYKKKSTDRHSRL